MFRFELETFKLSFKLSLKVLQLEGSAKVKGVDSIYNKWYTETFPGTG